MRRTIVCVCIVLLFGGCSPTSEQIPEAPKTPPPPTHEKPSGPHLRRLVDETFGDNRLVIDSFGDSLMLVGQRCIRGEGFELSVSNTTSNKTVISEHCLSSGGWDAIVDYSDLGRGILRTTWCTWDPRASELGDESENVPFIRETFLIDKPGVCKRSEELLLAPEEGGPKRVDELRNIALEAAIGEHDLERMERDYCSALGHLRNIGVSSPERVLKALRSLKVHVDGHSAEILSGYIDEVEWIENIKTSQNKEPKATGEPGP